MGPPPPSKSLLILRMLLCFLLPAILSTNTLQDGDFQGSLGWIKYFVVVSILLVLESLLDHCSMFQTKPWMSISYKVSKLVLIVWCLAPTQYNGSDITYNHVLAPLFHLYTDIALYLTDVTPVIIYKFVDDTVTGLHILGERVHTVAQYSLTGLQYVACKIKCSFNIATEYFLTGAQFVFYIVTHYTGQAIQHFKNGTQLFVEYFSIIVGKICQYSQETYTIVKHILEKIAREIFKTFQKFGEILARLVCNTVCSLKYSVGKIGEGSKAILMVSLDLLSKTRSTGEEYRLMSGLLKGDKGDQPRRLISDWFKVHSALIG